MKSVIQIIFILGISICINTHAGIPDAAAQTNEKELFLVAQKAFDDGFYDVAIRYINQFLTNYPQTEKRVQAELLLGQCFFFKGQYLKAFNTFQGLLKYTEFKDATLFWLGETYLKGADYTQAEKHFKQVLEVYPDSLYAPEAKYSLAWTYFDQKKYKEASKIYTQLIRNHPAHQLAEDAAFKIGECSYNNGDYKEAIEYFQEYILRHTNSTRHDQAYFYIAESYYYAGKYAQANSYYKKTADLTYDNKLLIMAMISQGWGHLKLGEIEKSRQAFQEAQKIATAKNILSDDIYLGQATLYSETEEHHKALEAYEQLINNFPNSPRISEAHLGKANILYALKKYDEAVEAYQAVIDKFNETPATQDNVEKAYFGLAWTYLKNGDIDLSIKTFEAVKDKTKNNIVKVSALTQIGDAYHDIGELAKALEVYDSVLEEYPGSLYADYVQYRQGIVLLKMERIEGAILSLQSLQTNFPESQYLHEAKYYLGVAYFRKGDWGSAQEKMEEYLAGLSGSAELIPESEYVLALSLFNLEEYDKALKIFEKIIAEHSLEISIVKNAEMGIAKSLYNLNRVSQAIKKFQMIVDKYPKSTVAQDALLWLAEYYYEKPDFPLSEKYFRKLINDFPKGDKISIARYELGGALEAQQKYEDALNQYRLINDPKNKEINAKARLAIADIFSIDVDSAEAVAEYKKIATNSPEFERASYLKIAKLYHKNHEYKKEIEAYENALKAQRGLSTVTDAELQFNIGDTYEILNLPSEAIEAYLKIPYLYTKDAPWVIKAYLRIARIFEDEEDWENAKVIYNKIIALKTAEAKFAKERLQWIKENVSAPAEPN